MVITHWLYTLHWTQLCPNKLTSCEILLAAVQLIVSLTTSTLSDSEIMLNKTLEKLWKEAQWLKRDPGVAWMSEYIPLVGYRSYRQPISVSFSGCTMSVQEGVGVSVGVTMVREAHGVKFVCLMMWTYVGSVLTRRTPVTSVQTQIKRARTHASGGENVSAVCMHEFS